MTDVSSSIRFAHVHTTALITIPKFSLLEDLVMKFKKDFKPRVIAEYFTEKNYSSLKMREFSGAQKCIHLLSFNKKSSLEDGVRFMEKDQSAILPGASGLLIAWQFLKEILPNGAILYGLDARKSLFYRKSAKGDAFMVPLIHTLKNESGLIAGCYNADSVSNDSELRRYLFYFGDRGADANGNLHHV